jgi:hypothetical protein
MDPAGLTPTLSQSPIQAFATIFEGNADAKRKPKDQRATRPRKGSKGFGKKKAPSPGLKSLKSEDDDGISLVNDSFVATVHVRLFHSTTNTVDI